LNLSPLTERSGHLNYYYVVIRARFIGERLFSYLATVQKRPQK
jgi:hypothetical protein